MDRQPAPSHLLCTAAVAVPAIRLVNGSLYPVHYNGVPFTLSELALPSGNDQGAALRLYEATQRQFRLEEALPAKQQPIAAPQLTIAAAAGIDDLTRQDAPQDNQDAPQDNQDAPQDNQDAPQDNQDAPQDNQDAPQDNQDAPQDNQDAPQDNQDAPQDNQDVPQDNQDAPQDNQDAPQDNPDAPQDNQETQPLPMEEVEESASPPPQSRLPVVIRGGRSHSLPLRTPSYSWTPR